jgi:hypothetical protein
MGAASPVLGNAIGRGIGLRSPHLFAIFGFILLDMQSMDYGLAGDGFAHAAAAHRLNCFRSISPF